MHKKTLGIITLLTLTAGGLFYAKTRSNQNLSLTSNSSLPETISNAQQFAKAIESGKPYTCTITNDDSTIQYQLKDGKTYMVINTQDQQNYMINDTEYIYSWSDQSAKGTKMAIPSQEETEELERTTESSLETPDIPDFTSESDYQDLEEQNLNINCQPGSINNSIFTPPTNIDFIDPTAMLKQTMPDGENIDMEQLQEMAKQFQNN